MRTLSQSNHQKTMALQATFTICLPNISYRMPTKKTMTDWYRHILSLLIAKLDVDNSELATLFKA